MFTAFFILVVGPLVGFFIGRLKGRPMLGAALGLLSWVGWIIMALLPREGTGKVLGSGLSSGNTPGVDYEYKGLRGMYLAIILADQKLVVKGAAGKRGSVDCEKTLAFSDLRGASTFTDAAGLMQYTGIQLEINNLDTPMIRVVMTPRDAELWLSRVIQVSGMHRI